MTEADLQPCAKRARIAAAAMLAALAAALGGCGGNGAPKPAMVGFNEVPEAVNARLQAGLNAPVRRMSVGWNEVEARRGAWDWSRADREHALLRAAGLRPLIVAVAAPCWAHPSRPCAQGATTGGDPPEPRFDADWARFTARLAARYPDAVAIEIWNEENLTPLFLPRPDPVRYAALLRAAHHAIRRAGGRMPVISGGLFASRVSGPAGLADARYLAAMYRAGAKGAMDGIGIHPYLYSDGAEPGPPRYDPRSVARVLARLRAVRDAAGDHRTPFWITETGESTATQPGFPPAAGEAQQARDLEAVVRSALAADDVAAVIVHRVADRPAGLGGPYAQLEAGFGVFGADGRPKRAACVLSRLLGGNLDC